MLRCQARDSGTDRSRIREYKLPPLLYFPVDCRVALPCPAQHRPHLDPALWPEIAERARRDSLRTLAVEYGVSHEAIRAIVRREASKSGADEARARPGPEKDGGGPSLGFSCAIHATP